MKALSIKQPWLWCITDNTKRIENRSWRPPGHIIGQRIALHASKSYSRYDWYAASAICVERVPMPGTSSVLTPLGAIVATAVVTGFIVVEESTLRYVGVDGSVVTVHDADPWFFGPVGWVLEDVHKLARPVPCKGALGLWTVPDDVVAKMVTA